MTTTSKEQLTILVPLDALLDTHMGTVYRLSSQTALKLMTGNYHKRYHNHPWDYTNAFSKKDYENLWALRDIDTLKVSVATKIPELIYASILKKGISGIDKNIEYNVTVKINSSPYLLRQDVSNELIATVKDVLRNSAVIEIISVAEEKISPSFLRNERINSFIVMDINEWLSMHYLELVKSPLSDVECIAPMSSEDYTNRLNNAIAAGKIDGEIVDAIDPFRAAEIGLSYLIKLSFLPLEAFSSPPLKEEIFKNGE